MATVLITGGTGLIGIALGQALLTKGYSVIILSREVAGKPATGQLSYASWNIEQQSIDKEAFGKADYIIHLAGAGVADKRWTKKRKQEIVDSRVNGSRMMVHSLKTIPHKVKALVSSSAIGWYGPDPVVPNFHPFEETHPADTAFLGDTCRQWEESIDPVSHLGVRLVKLRTGIVLSKKGGALKEFLKPLRFGVAAILGTGKQIISWIHIDDLVKMFIAAIENEILQGAYNAVAPNPVSNKELTLTLARSRQRFYIPIHVPSFVLTLVLGEMSIEVLKSATVSAAKIKNTDFEFEFPTIEKALTAIK